MDNNQSNALQQELDQLQLDIKGDLLTIPTLKLGILPAKTFYGALLLFVLKLSLLFMLINLIVQIGLNVIGVYHSHMRVGALLGLWGCALGASVVIALFINQFILFSKLVKGRLKTEAFIRKKWRHFSLIYFLIYSLVYFLAMWFQSSFSLDGDAQLFNFIFAQFIATVFALVATALIVNMEIERLGLGIVFDVISAFIEKIKHKPTTMSGID